MVARLNFPFSSRARMCLTYNAAAPSEVNVVRQGWVFIVGLGWLRVTDPHLSEIHPHRALIDQ
jgi:hypothetical protein